MCCYVAWPSSSKAITTTAAPNLYKHAQDKSIDIQKKRDKKVFSQEARSSLKSFAENAVIVNNNNNECTL